MTGRSLAAVASAAVILLTGCGVSLPTVFPAPHPHVTGQQLAGVPRPAPSPLVRQKVDPTALQGAAPEQVAVRLGPAELVRREGANRVWQYRGRECVVDLFFVAETLETDPVLIHMEARALTGGETTVETCLSEVAASRSPQSTGL